MIAPDQNSAFEQSPILASATQIVSAHLGNNSVALSEVPGFIKTVFAVLTELEDHQQPADSLGLPLDIRQKEVVQPVRPAVAIDASVHPDYLICLEDGKKLRMLKRYLMAQFGMTPEQYRAKWGLPNDYPMVAPAVSDQRRRAAMDSGLGRAMARKTARKKPRGKI